WSGRICFRRSRRESDGVLDMRSIGVFLRACARVRRVHGRGAGLYTFIINGRHIPLNAGAEYLIPQGVLHGGEVLAGTRTIHAFGGHRASRIPGTVAEN